MSRTFVNSAAAADIEGYEDIEAQGSIHRGRSAMTPTSDRSLLDRLRHGDEQSMSEIFDRHLRTIYNYCYRRTSSRTAAEDLASAVFLEAWRHRRRAIEVDGTILPWLYGIATNLCRNHLRSQRRHDAAVRRLQLVDAPAADQETLDRMAAEDRLRRALQRVAVLPARDQDVFFLVCWQELTYEQAAASLGIPVGTVRSRMARVRQQLRLNDASHSHHDHLEEIRHA